MVNPQIQGLSLTKTTGLSNTHCKTSHLSKAVIYCAILFLNNSGARSKSLQLKKGEKSIFGQKPSVLKAQLLCRKLGTQCNGSGTIKNVQQPDTVAYDINSTSWEGKQKDQNFKASRKTHSYPRPQKWSLLSSIQVIKGGLILERN